MTTRWLVAEFNAASAPSHLALTYDWPMTGWLMAHGSTIVGHCAGGRQAIVPVVAVVAATAAGAGQFCYSFKKTCTSS